MELQQQQQHSAFQSKETLKRNETDLSATTAAAATSSSDTSLTEQHQTLTQSMLKANAGSYTIFLVIFQVNITRFNQFHIFFVLS